MSRVTYGIEPFTYSEGRTKRWLRTHFGMPDSWMRRSRNRCNVLILACVLITSEYLLNVVMSGAVLYITAAVILVCFILLATLFLLSIWVELYQLDKDRVEEWQRHTEARAVRRQEHARIVE